MNPISGAGLANFITKMTKADAMGPIIALEATVTGGRTIQAYKRGGNDEARERFIEEGTGAIVWLGGVKFLNWVGDKVLEKLFGGNFDVGTDKVLRTPFQNFMKNNPPKGYGAKQVAIIKAVKVLASVLLADAFIGLVVPPLNQRLTRNIRKQRDDEKLNTQDRLDIKQNKNSINQPSFKGALEAINVFTNAIENTNTGKLLSTDAGLVSGRMYSARNGEERKEIAIRDIGSIYFYMWAQGHMCNLLNFAEIGRFNRLNPTTAATLDNHLNEFLASKGGEMSVEEFKKAVLGNKNSAKLPEGIQFESAELSKFQKFLNKHRKNPIEPLQVAKVSDLEAIITDTDLMKRIREMAKLQPERMGEAVITKQQILDAVNKCEINNPKLLDKAFTEFTEGASKNPYKYVSNKKLYNLKELMENYIDDLCNKVKDGKITKEVLKKAKTRNIAWSGANFVAGFAFAAAFLSTLIPKFQYWYTAHTTGKHEFPGMNDPLMEKEIANA